jgi:hypothetical protein
VSKIFSHADFIVIALSLQKLAFERQSARYEKEVKTKQEVQVAISWHISGLSKCPHT